MIASGLLFLLLLSSVHAGCYPDSSKCVPDRPFQTKIQWHSCQEYCSKCQGFSMGDCIKSLSKLCNGKYQCKCSGQKVPIAQQPLERITCLMGV